jgi:hypothetical protein
VTKRKRRERTKKAERTRRRESRKTERTRRRSRVGKIKKQRE